MTKRRSSYYDDDWPSYPASRPKTVKDGIRAKSQRGAFAKNWWAERWIAALKRLMDTARLQRGRSYARAGQVMNIDVAPGHVAARVQGSRPKPYSVSIDLAPLDDAQWGQVLDALAAQALFAAQLLNGEMPPDVEEVFQAVRVPLFPESQKDLVTDCSCPDWANPCKHIAAVYYLLGERFDEDPFLLFELRGRTRDQIAAGLRQRRAGEAAGDESGPEPEPEPAEAAPLAAGLDRYWKLGPEAAGLAFDLDRPAVEMAVFKRLGARDLGALDARFLETQMERVYRRVAGEALRVAFEEGDAPDRAGARAKEG